MLKAMFSMSSAETRAWSVRGNQIAINTQVRIVPHLEMQVGSAALHGDAEQVVNIHAGEDSSYSPYHDSRTGPGARDDGGNGTIGRERPPLGLWLLAFGRPSSSRL
jgi:hypothetical protein